MFLKARALARALLTAVLKTPPRLIGGGVAGAVVGVALGGAYLAGGLAQDAMSVAKAAATPETQVLQYADVSFAAGAAQPSAPVVRTAAAQAPRRKPLFAFSPPARPYAAGLLSQSDLDCLSQAVYYEARGETAKGQAAVAQVVLNRVRHPAFPKSVCGVVYQGVQRGRGCQFSFACDGSTARRREAGAWAEARNVAERALSGAVLAEVGNATHFHVTSVSPQWRNLLRVAQVGTHVFYRFSGRNGTPQAFVAVPEASGPTTDVLPLSEDAPASLILTSAAIEPVQPEGKVEVAKPEATLQVVKPDAPKADAAPAPAAPAVATTAS